MVFVNLKTMHRTDTPPADKPLVLCLGNFDGVHRGHRQLIEQTLACKEAFQMRYPGIACGAWCFDPLPRPDGKVGLFLTTTEEKLRLFALCGLDYAILADFNEMKEFSPSHFVTKVLQTDCHCRHAVCGFNYRFGHRASASANDLVALFGGNASIVPPVMHNDTPISSTAIRACLQDGRVEEAAALLGRPYSLTAEILHGNRIGHRIGIPTVNQTFPPLKLTPKPGIYASWIRRGDSTFLAVSNIGTRPTVNAGTAINCETHILDFDKEMYGEELTVTFHHRLRDEVRFEDLDALQAQIQKDIREAKRYFA